ncbi:hypothetical protein C0081_07065 [Cohaesibacter celericrescens]|uniref:SF3 helicase domain-containing protein n=2 Tax=Cohaesibacter celericrescens TaxID=2067669 RepID=A0A2N5XTR2_9HYPH|nr:hypothetical protein C0081_07065 [Cohaesibacter celericrescens]
MPNDIGLPPDCPVQPLGMDGDTIYLVDAMGQLAAVGPSSFGQAFIQRLFGRHIGYAYWAWPAHSKENGISGFKAEKVRETFYTAADNKGLWNAVEKVRGLGAWRGDDGELILHCGDCLWIDGQRVETGENGQYFYPRRPHIHGPWEETVTHDDNPARNLFRILKTWNWKRPEVDPLLFMGWLGVGILGGALEWRPSMFLIGDKAVGKSTLQAIVSQVLGDGLVSSTDTTPAGIYQRVGNGSLPVAIDELEAEADNRRVTGVVKLARLAASGGLMLRGGQDHNGVEFQARSTFLFSAINPPPLAPQDLSRMAILSIDKLDMDGASEPPKLDPNTGPKLMRRMVDQWGLYDGTWQAYREALRDGGHDSRGQDTYGTFLACAHLMLGDEGVEEAGYRADDLSGWADVLAAQSLSEKETAEENWKACLEHLLTSRVDAWRNGSQHTIGALLEGYRDSGNSYVDVAKARELLAQVDLGLLPRGANKIDKSSDYLAVPNKGPNLTSLFDGMPWGNSVWTYALRQGPSDIIEYRKEYNKVKIGGVSRRVTLVNLTAFEIYAEEVG